LDCLRQAALLCEESNIGQFPVPISLSPPSCVVSQETIGNYLTQYEEPPRSFSLSIIDIYFKPKIIHHTIGNPTYYLSLNPDLELN
jgi:hypothetical protein